MNKLNSRILADLIGGPPLRVVVDLNEACNLRCSYCHIDAPFFPLHKGVRQMPVEAFGQVLRDVQALEVLELTITGGEVTLIRNIADYLKHLPSLGLTASQVITNGTLLSPGNIIRYRDAGVTRISISLDSFASQNDQYRGPGAFAKTIRGLRAATAAGLRINVISVLHSSNYLNWFNFSSFLREEGVASNNLSLICRLGRAEELPVWPGLGEEQVQWLIDDYEQRSKLLNIDGYRVDLNVGALSPGHWDGTLLPVHQLQDVLPGTEAVIKVSGDVHINRIVGKNCAIGNIYRSGLREIWRDSQVLRLSIADAIIQDPDSNAENYYHLSSWPARGRCAGADGAIDWRSPVGHIRTLSTGHRIVFYPDYFSACLSKVPN